MGCDIHPAIEGKHFGEWRFCAKPRDSRNYRFFSLLAGVRNYYGDAVKPLAELRGIPDDCHGVTRDHFLEDDANGHSGSWCSLAELKGFREQVVSASAEQLDDKWTVEYWDEWIEMGECVRKTLYFYDADDAKDECVRFVFNFDN